MRPLNIASEAHTEGGSQSLPLHCEIKLLSYLHSRLTNLHQVHLPDLSARNGTALNSTALNGTIPMVLSLSGSGARGTVDEAIKLSGYDSAGRMVHEYYQGNQSAAHAIAASQCGASQ